MSVPFKRRSARVAAKCIATAQSRVIGCRITGFRSRARYGTKITAFRRVGSVGMLKRIGLVEIAAKKRFAICYGWEERRNPRIIMTT